MSVDNWSRVKEVFDAALQKGAGIRAQFLDEACGDDAALRAEVESLLDSITEAKDFLDSPILSDAPDPAAWQLTEGQQISHYKVIAPVGIGGMGEVYLAEDENLKRRVALKIVPEDVLADKSRLLRFEREARVVSGLNHPNILTVFEFGAENGIHLMACEYVDGETLRVRLNKGPIPLPEVLDIATQILAALQSTHQADVVHRDIKPENVMIRTDGLVKVLDFGLAKLTVHDEIAADPASLVFSQPGMVMGTVAFMSPEQARGTAVDSRSDIFSFGVVLYEMLAGQSPFSGPTATDVLAAIIQTNPPPPSHLTSAIPDELDQLVLKALKKEAAERYQNVREPLAILNQLKRRLENETAAGRTLSDPSDNATVLMTSIRSGIKTPDAFSISLHDSSPTVGRENEILEIAELIRNERSRVVTLTGIGGTGKTRLSKEVARQIRHEFRDGVFFIELESITDPMLVVPAIAQPLAVREAGPKNVLDSLIDHLHGRSVLLVLDNFEQVIPAGVQLAQLLKAAFGLKILVTSREPLRLSVETEYPVPPLGLPPSGITATAAELSRFEAVQLFLECAKRARADFTLTDENAAAVGEICSRLDGLPLAIELAAARVKVLSAPAILARLENRLAVLTAGAKDLPARQRTMRGAIEWSYELLTDAEKEVFRKLSVFSGGFTFDAAETVISRAAGEDSCCTEDTRILDLVTSLAEKSLLISKEQKDGEVRFRMLDVVRDYAWDAFAETEDPQPALRAHAEFFAALAEEAAPELRSARAAYWLERLEKEHENLRSAITWSIGSDAVLAAGIASAVRHLWTSHAHLREGEKMLEQILAAKPDITPALRWELLTGLGNMNQFTGDLENAEMAYRESLDIGRAANDQGQIAQSLRGLGAVDYMRSDFAAAQAKIDESLAICRAANDQFGIAASLSRLGDIAMVEGDPAGAYSILSESLSIFQKLGYKQGMASKQHSLGLAAFTNDDYASARSHFREALILCRELQDEIIARLIFDGFAATMVERGDLPVAARLAGIAEGRGTAVGYTMEPAETGFRDAYLAKLRAEMDVDEFDEAYTEGRHMTIEAATKLALDETTTETASVSDA